MRVRQKAKFFSELSLLLPKKPLHLVATCAANLVQSIWMRRAEGKGLWGRKCAECGHLGARDAGRGHGDGSWRRKSGCCSLTGPGWLYKFDLREHPRGSADTRVNQGRRSSSSLGDPPDITPGSSTAGCQSLPGGPLQPPALKRFS